jgi:hypothetical protein
MGPGQAEDGPKNRSGSGFGGFLVRAAVLFVVIVGGVATGFLIASHLSKRGDALVFNLEASGLLNRTALSEGDDFPDIHIRDEGDTAVALTPMFEGRRAILGFVSRGCEPCDELLEFFEEKGFPRPGDPRIVLLSVGVQRYESKGFECFRVERSAIDTLEIRMFPTVIGLDSDGKVSFVSSGFSRDIIAPVIGRHLH